MALRLAFCGLFLASACVLGADPIRLPSGPVVPDKMPAPPATGVLRVTPETLYVFDADVPVMVITSPPGLLSVTEEKGPVKIRGRFSEEPQRVQTKTFAGKSVFTVEAVKDGACEILVVPVGATDPAKVVRRLVESQVAPQPPPVPPKPDPDPSPKPDPAPKVESVWVIVVEDADAARTVETAKALNDPLWATLKPKHDWRHYLSSSKTAADNGYVELAKSVGFPAVLILSAKDGDPLRKFKLTTAADIDANVKAVTK